MTTRAIARPRIAALTLLVLATTTQAALAAPYTWTTSGSGSVLTDGAGTWNTSALNWTTTGTGAAVAWPNLTTDVAVFGASSGTAGTVTVESASTNGITFNQPGSGGYLLSGGTITLGGSSPTLTSNVGVSARIASSLVGSAGLGTGGGGTLTLSGSSSLSGAATIGSGEVILASGAALPSLTGLTVGTLASSATLRVQSGASLTVSISSGAGALIGNNTSRPSGTVIQEGGVVTLSGNAGSLVMSTNGSNTTYTGSASYVLQGGTLALNNTSAGFITVGRNATATFTQSGGAVTLARANDALTIGDYATGSYTISGGSLTAASGSANALLGYRLGNGTLTVSGSGSMGIGGSVFLAVNLPNYSSGKGSATINLQGGTLAVNGMTLGRVGITGSNGPGTATFNFSGGTLRPYSANTLIGWTTAANNFTIDLSGTGATLSGVDLAGSAARRLDVYATLQGTGNITVAGGTVALQGANTFSGTTTIRQGTLALASSGSFTNSPRIIVGDAGSSSAVLDLTAKTGGFTFGSGQTVSGTGTINIGTGVTVTSSGIWAPGNSIGSNTVTGNLALSGTSQFELGSPGTSTSLPGNSDFTAVSGTLTLGGQLQLVDDANGSGLGSAAGGVYRLFTYGNAVSGSFASVTANPTPTTRTSLANISYGGSGTTAGAGVFVSIYNLAQANAQTGTVNLGTVLKNSTLSGTLSIANTATGISGFTESLNAAFGSTTGNASGTGSVTALAAGGTNATAMVASLSTASAGGKNGTAQLTFDSNGAGTSGLGLYSLPSQTVTLTGTVLDPAVASFASGSTATTSLLLDFGSVQQNASVSPLGFSLFNLMQTNGFTADLALLTVLSDTGNSAAITTTLPGQFFNLASGSSFAYSASFSTTTLGLFQNVYTLQFKSANNGAAFTSDTTQNLTLTVQGVIVVPEPAAVALAGVGIGLAGWLIRRRR